MNQDQKNQNQRLVNKPSLFVEKSVDDLNAKLLDL